MASRAQLKTTILCPVIYMYNDIVSSLYCDMLILCPVWRNILIDPLPVMSVSSCWPCAHSHINHLCDTCSWALPDHFPLVEHQLWQSFRFIHPCCAKTMQCKISLLFFIANWAPEMAQFATEESGPENEGQHMWGPNKVGGNWPESVGSPLPYLGISPRVNLNWDKHSLKRLLCAFTICSWARLQPRPPKQCCYNAKFVIFYYHIVAAPSTAVFLCRILAYVS